VASYRRPNEPAGRKCSDPRGTKLAEADRRGPGDLGQLEVAGRKSRTCGALWVMLLAAAATNATGEANECAKMAYIPISELTTIGNTMTTNSTAVIDDTIHAAAIAKGFADASVVTQNVQDRNGALDVGCWLVLSVKRQAGDEWELLGRRRTEAELLSMIQGQRISA
jgi:hypothetical protein